MTSIVTIIFALAACEIVAGREFSTRLRVVQDVTLERGNVNFDYLKYLIVGTHPNYPLKRSLVQFHPLQVHGCDHVKRAYLFLYYAYAHKASFMSNAQVPSFPRQIVAHQVVKYWSESQATSTKRYGNHYWDKQWLNLGTDAFFYPTSSGVTITPGVNHPGFYPIDVTSAVRNWKNGQSNFGLLIRATNEVRQGRDFRFYSKSAYSFQHPYISVICESNSSGGNGGIVPVSGGGIGPAV
ncbi:uncharacterized protein LOC114528120 [Dendronephthya gigantea]|uniref:uncharacterized protein LOC114528120 n=1 Tax=Dendronephthya gigantea TaxID=151771 RepID=UPI001069DB1D|nr:uncharacterized protein LOC114528120 [Dendronephthya gigantea]